MSSSQAQDPRKAIPTILPDITGGSSAEEELKRERALLRAVVDTAVDGIITIDGEGIVLTANPATETIFGFDAGEMVGHEVEMLLPTPFREEFAQCLKDYVESGAKSILWRNREVQGLRKGGEVFPLDLAIGETMTSDGVIFTGIVRDISERRAAAEALRNALGQLNHLLDNSPAVLYALRFEGENMVPYMASRNLTEMLGYTVEETLNYQWWRSNVHPDDLPAAIEVMAETMSGKTTTSEYRMQCKQGGYRYVEDKKRLTYHSDGSPEGLVGVWTDITDRIESEEALRQSEERFRDLLENVELIALMLDTDAKVTFCNEHLLKLTGWTRDELLGRDWIDNFIRSEDQGPMRQLYQTVTAGEFAAHLENPICTRSGEQRDIHWSNILLRDVTGKVLGLAAIGEDVTDRNRALEALREALADTEAKVDERTASLAKANEGLRKAIDGSDSANRAKSEFLSRMSHELRTPLNSVLGYAQLLDLQYQEPNIKDAARSIIRGGKHLLAMINEVLDMTRLESGELALSPEPVELLSVLHQAMGLIRPLADAAKISVTIAGQDCDNVHVQADRQRLLQVLINVLGNAVKYNQEGGTVTVRCLTPAEEITRVEISDSGTGIAPGDQELLFQPFQRFGDPGIEGTGLGLALSRRFMTLMGGHLGLSESTPEGSTFYLELNSVNPEYKEKRNALVEQAEDTLATGRRGIVLYVEDNPSNMQFIAAVLSKSKGITLIRASHGQEGLDLAAEHHPDLILLDLNLSDLMGDTVLRTLKADPALAAIPVVMLSADATQRQITTLLGMGAAEYLTKPLDVLQFFETIKRFLPEE